MLSSWCIIYYLAHHYLDPLQDFGHSNLVKMFELKFLMKLFLTPVKWFQGPSSKDSESIKEGTKADKPGIFAKQRAALVKSLQIKRPASSVEADIVGTSTFNSQSLPKQECSTASSKAYPFKEGIPCLTFLVDLLQFFI